MPGRLRRDGATQAHRRDGGPKNSRFAESLALPHENTKCQHRWNVRTKRDDSDEQLTPADLLELPRKCPEINGTGEGNRTLVIFTYAQSHRVHLRRSLCVACLA